MRIAHLILAHKNPAQLERLIKALDHPAFDIYVHIDKKTDAQPFAHIFNGRNVFSINNRTKIYWAAYGTIQATINGFEEILPKGYDYINVISAQDFPLRTPQFIYQYIADRRGKEFITCESIEGEWKEAASRVTKYHLINWQVRGRHTLENIINKILPPRKFPLDHQLVGRANWFTLTSEAIKYSLDFLQQHPEVVRYYKYCWGADEFIFSTILFNSHFKDRIVDNLVYVDWSGPKTGHPRILTSDDFTSLIASDKLFARKFDMEHDARIFSLLEDWIKTKELTT